MFVLFLIEGLKRQRYFTVRSGELYNSLLVPVSKNKIKFLSRPKKRRKRKKNQNLYQLKTTQAKRQVNNIFLRLISELLSGNSYQCDGELIVLDGKLRVVLF